MQSSQIIEIKSSSADQKVNQAQVDAYGYPLKDGGNEKVGACGRVCGSCGADVFDVNEMTCGH